MTDTPRLVIEARGSGGRVRTADPAPDGRHAELTFTDAGAGRISADHTFVPSSLEGRGLGTALVERLHEHAAANGLEVVARCSFVQAKMAAHPEWRDVLAR